MATKKGDLVKHATFFFLSALQHLARFKKKKKGKKTLHFTFHNDID